MSSSLDTQNPSATGETMHQALHSLGELIRTWQLNQTPKLSDQALVNRFPQLGHTRTFKRIHTGTDIESLNADDWLPKYQAVWERIEGDELELSTEPIYDDLEPAVLVRGAWVRAMSQNGLQRLILVEGDTGAGKSSALSALKGRIGNSAYLLESHEGWSRLRTALECLASALSIRPTDGDKRPQSSGDWLELLIERMNKRGKRVVLIDECHHWGGEMLNALKTLINRTNWVFIIAGMRTLIEKLTAAKSQEAKQLLLNRMLEKIQLSGPTAADARRFLTRRAQIDPATGDAILARLAKTAMSYGGFAFLRRVANRLARLPEGAARGEGEIEEAMELALADLGY